MKKIFTIITISIISLASLNAQNETLAFPGAEGHGRFTTGGRGGKVVRVTNLKDNASGEPIITGSLRWALQQSGTKTIVFDVSGTIELKQQLKTGKDNITFAGQTAPYPGICIGGDAFVINSNNIIIRFIRFRPGDGNGGEPDGIGGTDKKNIIIDHCSASWSVDECLAVYGMENLTVQWCLGSEALRVSTHGKGTHGYGGIWGGNKASYHHNLIAHSESRVPRLGPRPSTQENEHVDMRNNVFYNWAGEGCYGAEGMKVNIINNYYKPGPATDAASAAVKYRIAKIDVRTTEYVTNNPSFAVMKHVWGKFYVDGNKIDGNTEVTNDNWTKGVYAQQTNSSKVDNLWTQTTKDTIKLNQPLDPGYVTTHTADLAYERVLDYVGCSLNRDEVDERIIADVRERKATFTASGNKKGYINTPADTKPSGAGDNWTPWLLAGTELPPLDSDGDGIPDEWEDAHGLDKNNPADGALISGGGYSNLELYLNSLVADIIENQNKDGVPSAIESESVISSQDHKLSASYNKATNNLTVKANANIANISVFGLTGNIIKQVKVNTTEANVDGLESYQGVMIIKAQFEDNTHAVAKVIK